jgi:hypothetical protein
MRALLRPSIIVGRFGHDAAHVVGGGQPAQLRNLDA